MLNLTTLVFTIDIIILIDDDPISNYLSMHTLKKTSWGKEIKQIKCFEDPEKGLVFIAECFSANYSILLLLDINMPTLTGWDVLDVLARHTSKALEGLTVYMLTSSTDMTEIERSSKYPFVAKFLSKPLINNLPSILSGYPNERE